MSNIKFEFGQHIAVVGATGSGKTVWSKEFMLDTAKQTRGLVPFYIIDSKAQGDFNSFARKGYGKQIIGQRPPSPQTVQGEPFIIWTPETDDFDTYENFLESLYRFHRKNNWFFLWVDEISSLIKGSHTPPPAYEKLLKQARGMHGTIATASQSPSYIPPSFLRQASHMLRFHLNDDYDIKKLANRMGKAVIDEPFDDYGFWYRYTATHIRKAPPVYYKHMQEFFGLE